MAGGEQGQKPLADSKPNQEPAISGAPKVPQVPVGEQKILSREERVEYRDQDGNLLDEEQVKALQGKVEFKTRYETRTRIVDANGNEVPLPAGGEQQGPANLDGASNEAPMAASPEAVAPPHPDIEGAEPETKRLIPDEPIPAAKKSVEGEKENSEKSAKPASEGNDATAQQAQA